MFSTRRREEGNALETAVLQPPICDNCFASFFLSEARLATKLKVVKDVADIVPAPTIPDFDIAPTRNQHSGWTVERQRKFIDHLSLTGSVGDSAALAGVSSRS